MTKASAFIFAAAGTVAAVLAEPTAAADIRNHSVCRDTQGNIIVDVLDMNLPIDQ